MFVLTRNTLLNPGALDTVNLPKRVLGRVMIWPRRGASGAFWARLIFEVQPLRYTVLLLPFMAAIFIWPHLALPIAQAPVPMLIVIGVVELKVLRRNKASRAALISEDDAARTLDLLHFRGQDALRRIVARRKLQEGEMQLIVEQSEMARITPLTLVSLQRDQPKPHVVDLDEQERQILHATLFDADLTERDLHNANLRYDTFLRDVTLDARGVSAHARLEAALA
ncbi:MAG: hypothetical protein ACFB11_15350 [Paracoccaceae bacterium]